jgi:cytochrome c biogenesis protein CcmG/thiol:disulfide interchange protein DsbE
VVGVDFIDPQPGRALAFAKDLGLTYPQLADPLGATKAPLHIPALPWTFFLDATGRVSYIQAGPITSEHQLTSLLHDHLGVRVPGLETSS